ncbi:MAG: hypothetical protein H0T62_05375 [Parachlamydiaceae bacterium]|nr:hypothetical protein [Parachlamydiaceae bacterium]
MLTIDQIKDNQYKDLSQSIEITSFYGQAGLYKACELSEKIYNLQFAIFRDQGHSEYQIKETEFYCGERFIQELDDHACQSRFLSSQFESLHDKLIKKVVIAQKGSLIFPFSLHQKNQKENNELIKNYLKICEELKDFKNKKLVASFETFNNSHDIFNPQRNKISFTNQDKFQEKRLTDEKKIKVEQLIRGLVKVKKCKRFLEPVLHELCTKVETEQESKGFFFRVTNRKGVHSYLVGTIHAATNQMAQMPALNHVIDHSDRLILEVSSLILNASYRLRRLDLTNPYRNCIDLTLYDAAWHRNLPIESLETVKDQISALYGDAVANASYSEILGTLWLVQLKQRLCLMWMTV